jgi:tetratricopeptide (TPR) repeat protein
VSPTFLLLSKSANNQDGGTRTACLRGLLPIACGCVLLLLFCGCALTGKAPPEMDVLGLPPRVHLADVPFFPQKAYQCGPAALAAALNSSGVAVSAQELVPRVYTPERKGSLQSGMVGAARRYERLAYPVHELNCLLRQVASDRPVIVMQNLGLSWLPRWHYAVVVGYDLTHEHIILNTGSRQAHPVKLSVFLNTWRRADQWGLLVIRADRIPDCADEQVFLKSALGLQQAGMAAAARLAFDTATRQWPGSYAAHMALGNVDYALGDLEEAAQAFRKAIEIETDNPMGFNNLAQVLSELGFTDQALQMAQKAVDLGGPNAALYRQTADEIRQRRATDDAHRK